MTAATGALTFEAISETELADIRVADPERAGNALTMHNAGYGCGNFAVRRG